MSDAQRVVAPLELIRGRAISEAKIGDICALGSHRLAPILQRLESVGAIKGEFGPGFSRRQRFYEIT